VRPGRGLRVWQRYIGVSREPVRACLSLSKNNLGMGCNRVNNVLGRMGAFHALRQQNIGMRQGTFDQARGKVVGMECQVVLVVS
jgi:hypothetical protein